MYHALGPHSENRRWNHLVTTASDFDQQLSALERGGFRTVTWTEVMDHQKGLGILPRGRVLLTFDDGYADNWSIAAPILERYGMTGIVFVSGEFIEPGTAPRSGLDRAGTNKLQGGREFRRGFLNEAEIAALARHGPLEIGSHAMTHTWYPASGKVNGFWCGDTDPYWMAWNVRPDAKWAYIQDPDWWRVVPRGRPIFPARKALAGPRFFPDEDAMALVEAEASRHEGCDDGSLRERLWRFVQDRFMSTIPGHQESNTAYEERVYRELGDSKRLLERIAQRPVEFLCWPGGGVSATAGRIAAEVGYRAWTLPASLLTDGHWNRPGDDPRQLRRISSGTPWVWRGRAIPMPPGRIIDVLRQFEVGGRVGLLDKARRLLRVPFYWAHPRIIE